MKNSEYQILNEVVFSETTTPIPNVELDRLSTYITVNNSIEFPPHRIRFIAPSVHNIDEQKSFLYVHVDSMPDDLKTVINLYVAMQSRVFKNENHKSLLSVFKQSVQRLLDSCENM